MGSSQYDPNGNPYILIGATCTEGAEAIDKKINDDRASRMGLDTFLYHCTYAGCRKEHEHSSGYIFTLRRGGDEFYFCNVNCCDAFEKDLMHKLPVTDRRGAVAATKAKNNAEVS